MANVRAVQSPEDAWDTGELGRDEAHVKVSPEESNEKLDEGLELQMISIRFQASLIDQLKFIAAYHQIGYQPLIRDVMARWAKSEVLNIAREMKEQIEAAKVLEAAAQKRA